MHPKLVRKFPPWLDSDEHFYTRCSQDNTRQHTGEPVCRYLHIYDGKSMYASPKTLSNQHISSRGQPSLVFLIKAAKRAIKEDRGALKDVVSVPWCLQTYGSFFQRGCVAYMWAGWCASVSRSVWQCGPKMWHRGLVVSHDPPGSWVGEGGRSTHDAAQSINNPPRSMWGCRRDGVHLIGTLLSSSFFYANLMFH